MTVELREVTCENWVDCVKLTVADDQKHFVAPNDWSLVEAHYEGDRYPRAIYNDAGEMVGFAMYTWEAEKDRWWIERLMTDQRYQKQGYGRAAMLELLKILGEVAPGKEISISYDSDNDVARRLYASLGFIETGEIEDGEVVAVKPGRRD